MTEYLLGTYIRETFPLVKLWENVLQCIVMSSFFKLFDIILKNKVIISVK